MICLTLNFKAPVDMGLCRESAGAVPPTAGPPRWFRQPELPIRRVLQKQFVTISKTKLDELMQLFCAPKLRADGTLF
jgi:hypothetical protein